MKHDVLCEVTRWPYLSGCDCASRTYRADPWVDDDGRTVHIPPRRPLVEWSTL